MPGIRKRNYMEIGVNRLYNLQKTHENKLKKNIIIYKY